MGLKILSRLNKECVKKKQWVHLKEVHKSKKTVATFNHYVLISDLITIKSACKLKCDFFLLSKIHSIYIILSIVSIISILSMIRN